MAEDARLVTDFSSEVPELYRVLTGMLIQPEGITWRERNEVFMSRLRATKAYARNQDFRALVDHLQHYHRQVMEGLFT